MVGDVERVFCRPFTAIQFTHLLDTKSDTVGIQLPQFLSFRSVSPSLCAEKLNRVIAEVNLFSLRRNRRPHRRRIRRRIRRRHLRNRRRPQTTSHLQTILSGR